jgi:plastocyanin
MKLRTFPVGAAAVAATLACSSAPVKADQKPGPKPAEPRSAPRPAAAAPAPAGAGGASAARPAKLGPIGEKAQLLREAAEQLEKAGQMLERGNKNFAEQLFSTAELLVGAEALAQLAPMFREGAPPRVTAPTQKVDLSAAPQPKAGGSSEADDEAAKVPPPKVELGNVTGTLQIDGKPVNGFGLVTLEPASGKWKPRVPKRAVVEQRGREFSPNLVAIPVGSTVVFPNFDSVFHNVFSSSPIAPFDLGLYKAGEAREYKFEKEGIVRLGCNLHANMSAYIAVVAAPAYTVTDAKGEFAFKRVIPGKYKLRAWSVRSSAPITQDVTIKPGKNTLDVGVSGDGPTGAPPDKFGGKRG